MELNPVIYLQLKSISKLAEDKRKKIEDQPF
jgi:hypothetical protein